LAEREGSPQVETLVHEHLDFAPVDARLVRLEVDQASLAMGREVISFLAGRSFSF
jgi:hypothetical protein